MKRYIQYAMLFTILLMYGSPALAQRYGVKGSWHITDTLFAKYIVPESTKIGIVFRNNDTVYFPLVYVDTIRQTGQQLMIIPDTAYFNANNDAVKQRDTAAVSIKTYRHSGVSILQIEGLGDSSYAYIWMNVRDSVNAAADINRSPYFEWNAYKHTGMKGSVISQLTRKGGKDASGVALNTILYLGMEGDSTVIDSLRIRGIGSYTNLFYNQVRTPDSNVTTKGQVKRLVSGVIDTMTARYAKNSDSLGHVAAASYPSLTNISDSIKSSLYFRESIPWDKLIAYSKMDNPDTAITWYPDSAAYIKPFVDLDTDVPTVRGLLYNCLDFTGANNQLRRAFDRDFFRNNFTFMTFFKHAPAADDKPIVIALDTATAVNGWRLTLNSNGTNGAMFTLNDGTNDWMVADSAFTNWDDNNWHFICGVADSVNGWVSIQIDTAYQKRTGVNLASFVIYSGTAASTKMSIGYDAVNIENFSGYLDDWMYFSTALTRSQVEMVRQYLLGTVVNTKIK